MRKNLTYCSFIITSLVVILVFVSATTYAQLIVAILLYLPLAYFAFKHIPYRTRKKRVTAVQPLVKPSVGAGLGIADIDRRAFLKLIGGAGLALFVYSIFTKRGASSFFKSASTSGSVSLEDSTGNKIDPAQNHPTDGYRITEVDDSIVTFFGFTDKDGAWFIMREDTDLGTFRYVRGASNFPTNWSNRENLAFDYYNNVF